MAYGSPSDYLEFCRGIKLAHWNLAFKATLKGKNFYWGQTNTVEIVGQQVFGSDFAFYRFIAVFILLLIGLFGGLTGFWRLFG